MYIYLDKNICLAEYGTNASCCHALENILAAGYEGNHFVYADLLTMKNIATNEALSGRSKAYLNKQIAWYPQKAGFINTLIPNIIIDGQITTAHKADNSTWHVPLLEFRSMSFGSPTTVLSENLHDSQLYLHAAEHFKISKGLNGVSISATPQAGGGSTTYKELKRRAAKAEGLCLCIVDSDKLSPKSSYGDTANNCLKEISGNEWWLSLRITEKRELENEIPKKFIEYSLENKKEVKDRFIDLQDKVSKIDSSIWDYLDIKQGLLLSWVLELPKDSETKKYWEKTLKSYNPDKNCDENCLKQSICNQKAINQKCKSPLILDGVSVNISETVLEYLNKQGFHKSNSMINTTNDQNWLSLGELVFMYCFGSTATRI